MSKNIRPAFHGDGKTDEVSGIMRERGVRRPTGIAGGLLGAEYAPRPRNALSGRFMMPPFSVLNAREGDWQERKRAWLGLGIRSELGRGENLLKFSDTVMAAQAGGLKNVLLYHPEADCAFWASRAEADTALRAGDPLLVEVGPEHEHYEKIKKLARQGLTWNDPDQMRNREKTKKRFGQAGNLGDAAAMLSKKGKFATAGKSAYLLPPTEDGENVLTGTSIFDPVLCEVNYRWFCPEGGSVLDPFSGGSVRGIVAGELGLAYTGVDLSARQIDANREQAKEIGTTPVPTWIAGDSCKVLPTLPAESFDFIFSCPPYGSLEVYSEDPADISNMSADDFTASYFEIIAAACRCLKPNRFACFVVGDYRNSKTGYYENLPAKTIVAFEEAGLHYYNSAILITAIGSLPMRINQQFLGSRKLGKTHQDLLCFCKGQPREFVKTWTGNLIEKVIK